MAYRLDRLMTLCDEFGFECRRRNADELEISLAPECVLLFQNAADDQNTAFGKESN